MNELNVSKRVKFMQISLYAIKNAESGHLIFFVRAEQKKHKLYFLGAE